ncbi:hypothetical protein MSHI_13920 [Mycobacterium shinjukuense]|uniref:Uncharacterized protein n=1 Tax=Mycobacterium shinjukuense TaxID=398694 RepID=A0A7I7MMW9_9MYCO|nr:hypothetical protein MSHI_13920 [Mycobacterium shinjukuense]
MAYIRADASPSEVHAQAIVAPPTVRVNPNTLAHQGRVGEPPHPERQRPAGPARDVAMGIRNHARTPLPAAADNLAVAQGLSP